MDGPSYRSFLVRLWHEPHEGRWHGEVEVIQTGAQAVVESLEQALQIIRQTTEAAPQDAFAPQAEEQGGASQPGP